MGVGADHATHATERVLGHDERRGALEVGRRAAAGRHDEVGGRAVGRAGPHTWFLLAVLATGELGVELGVGQEESVCAHC